MAAEHTYKTTAAADSLPPVGHVQGGQHLAGSAVREQCYVLVSHGHTNARSVSDGLYICVAVTVLQTSLSNQEPVARFACDRSPFPCKASENPPYVLCGRARQELSHWTAFFAMRNNLQKQA
jgi:hypothetical protein